MNVLRPAAIRAVAILLIALAGRSISSAAEPRSKTLPPKDAAAVREGVRRGKEFYAHGKYREAEMEARLCVTRLERYLGSEHSKALDAHTLVASALFAQKKYSESEEEYRKVYEIQERVLGPAHRDTLRSRSALCRAWIGQRKYAKAENAYRAILKFQEKSPGPLDAETLETRAHIARVLSYQEKNAQAEAHFRLVLGDMETALGTEHPTTLLTRGSFIVCLGKGKKLPEARQAALRLVESSRKVFGLSDPKTKRFEALHRDLTKDQFKPVAGPEVEIGL